MKNTAQALASVLAATLLSLPLLATAAPRAANATMQVSFIVKEACSVQNDAAAPVAAAAATGSAATSARPSVACQFHTPYQLSRGADQAATVNSSATDTGNAIRTNAGAQDWTITF
jgi:hypothetical protein